MPECSRSYTQGQHLSSRGLKDQIQQATDELLDRVQDRGQFDICGEFAFLLPTYGLSGFLSVHKKDRDRLDQWSVDFIDFFNNILITVDTPGKMAPSASEMIDYKEDLLGERRREAGTTS
jgi:cytochrome P450